ncbi:FecR family protein [Sphingobacterium multivorum]|uniref:FecR family protein n=1 Tax=Sphingobacterium multivorum TaxID=28454 RepID=UPI0028ADD59F|nr:FecR domain-containing protein [Sphingobacterium multivorum]
MMNQEHGNGPSLLKKYLEGKCTTQEQALVEEWYLNLGEDQIPSDKELISDVIELQKRLKGISKEQPYNNKGYIIAIAAILLAFFTIGTILYLQRKNNQESKHELFVDDIAPGKNKALLSIDGQPAIALDGKNSSIISKEGSLGYNNGTTIIETENVKTIRLSTPAAGQFEVVLPDGTKAWLNALSSITYPAAFIGKERQIQLTGEVYLEVTKNIHKPFVIQTAQQRIEVLGTGFNVNTYNDNGRSYTTLVSGSLRIMDTKTKHQALLSPGQQAIVNGKDAIEITTSGIEDSYAWKDGLYVLHEEPLSQYARKIERWYDVEVEMGPYGDRKFSAIIPRDAKLSEVLQAIELKSNVKFTREGRRIVAMR